LIKRLQTPKRNSPRYLRLLIAVENYKKRVGYHFSATRVRGVHPRLFTTKDIMGFTEDELHDYTINCDLLDAIRFMCDNIVPD
jgi:hypothetical protein